MGERVPAELWIMKFRIMNYLLRIMDLKIQGLWTMTYDFSLRIPHTWCFLNMDYSHMNYRTSKDDEL